MTTSPTVDSTITPQRVLVIDDESVIGTSIKRILTPDGHDVQCLEDAHAGMTAALAEDFDVIFLDLMMPGLGGIEILRHLKSAGVTSEVVIVTGNSTVDTAVEAMKEGATDFIPKPFSPNQLKMVLQKVSERSALIRENAALRQELGMARGLEGIIGESQAMQRVFALLERVAPTDGTVLVTGESGTGKEMVVRAIHRLSRRKNHPLLACDCSALAPVG
jgi:DNA-binding NtrC family response regulator